MYCTDSAAKIIAMTLEKTLMIFLLIKSPDLETIKKTINVSNMIPKRAAILTN